MDAKAAARASFQRSRARQYTRKQKPQLQQQQQSASGSERSQRKADLHLPSNWGRYDEENEEEEAKRDERLSDVPPVKSKGANYRDLLAEKSMLQGPDLARERKGLMVARGLDLWSCFTDMDNLWSVHVVSDVEDNFFTLDLDFLNKELTKIDIAERLLVDAKYIPAEEREKSQRLDGTPRDEKTDDSEALSNSGSRTTSDNLGFTKSLPSRPMQEVDGLHSSTSVENEAERCDFSGRFLQKTRATSKLDEIHVDSFPKDMLDSNLHPVSKEPTVQLPTAANSFDAKFAEAELDALLDMLDNKSSGQASSSIPLEPGGGLARSTVSASAESYTDALQERNFPGFSVRTSQWETLAHSGVSNDTPLHMMGTTKLAVKVGDLSSNEPVVKSASVPNPNLDQDFDEWLDSL